MTSAQPLAGRAALVTGASGGIGSAIARALGLAGASVVLHCSKDRAGAAALEKELSALNVRCRVLRADLLASGAPEKLIRDAAKAFGSLDILVNNAGAVLGEAEFTELPLRDFQRTMRLNAEAPFLLSREAFKRMAAKGWGRIVNVSSIGAKFGGSARSLHYAASKGALETMSIGMGRIGAPKGVLVNAVRPGVIDTPFHGKFRKNMTERVGFIPQKRMGKPAEVAELVAFLCGPGGDYITGQVLAVTGGE